MIVVDKRAKPCTLLMHREFSQQNQSSQTVH
jgi:hypothetical protein